ncbi:MAG TPA: ATP-binding cassette domain-containing protein, partial [Thermoanaerobaculia bacterium]|nr:ATP-binding cassette domain-containing protein [Thermoanaerobaculia bacterium]
EIADRIVVMRGGRVVAEKRREETNASELAQAMVQTATQTRAGRHPNITAIVGVAGNGQPELAARFREEHPEAAHIPEDRTRDGIVAEMTIAENLALRGNHEPRAMIERYSIRASGPKQRAGDLSGGNQQKVVLARELHRRPDLIFAAEPTRGLDLAATAFVHEQLRAAADGGARVTLITSDLDEAFALAGTIQVIYRGALSEPMPADEAMSKVANLMGGLA